MVFVVLCLTLTMLLCAHLLWKCSYWQRHGVRGPRGLPILGNMWKFFLGRRHYGDVYKNIYDAHPHLPYIGIYRLFNEPAVLVRSQEMIKEVMIRSFQHFQDNVLWVDEKRDPIVCYNPFIAKGVQWKQMRAEILPIFTPNKVKASFHHIKSICEKLDAYVSLHILNSSNCFEGKDLFSKYTLDVVASAAYGLDGAALTNTNSDFTQLVENLFLPHAWSLLETIALLFSPQLGNLIKYHYVPTGVQDWLQGIIGKVLEIQKRFKDPHSTNQNTDADLYEQPLQFQPERFLHQNEKTHGCMFLGFGEGPRMCPGMRFGLAQSKAGIVTLLSKYSVHLCENNKPFKMSAKTFLTATDDGIWISFKERK
ncbi:PREDICTED: probable cytochrome P450 308a1 [Rhagoletis zephyria]|uniref:probable cytochrome P450 308a1 n=1 Tax=Rhagoletis zephyria TaxID=28612 RepID=UPI00081161F3|nr:PREDICTED: probable cytochrome P450 308a1 [Rhagoletis zephyria]